MQTCYHKLFMLMCFATDILSYLLMDFDVFVIHFLLELCNKMQMQLTSYLAGMIVDSYFLL